MSASPADGKRSSGFTIEPTNERFEANRTLIETVMDRGITLSFLGEVDLTEIDKIRSQSWTRPHISYVAFVVKAVALAIRDFPDANRRVFQAGFGPFARSRLCSFDARDVAVTVERDLPGIEVSTLVEILRDADAMPLDQITTNVQALNRAEANTNPLWRESIHQFDQLRFPAAGSSLGPDASSMLDLAGSLGGAERRRGPDLFHPSGSGRRGPLHLVVSDWSRFRCRQTSTSRRRETRSWREASDDSS